MSRFVVYGADHEMLATLEEKNGGADGSPLVVDEVFDDAAGESLRSWLANGVPYLRGTEVEPGVFQDREEIVPPDSDEFWVALLSASDERGWSVEEETAADAVLVKSWRMLKSASAVAAGPNCGTGHGGFKPGNTCGGKKKASILP